jgi:hypothetical protein
VCGCRSGASLLQNSRKYLIYYKFST